MLSSGPPHEHVRLPIRGVRLSQAPTPAEALRLILSQATPQPVEHLPLRHCAGRVLRQAVLAERDTPPFDRVCMDGAALSGEALRQGQRQFRLQAIQAAGAPPLALQAPDLAIEAMTGAVLPEGTDCVIPLEEYELAGDVLTVRPGARADSGRNIQRRGTDSRAGAVILGSGTRLGAAEIAVVASAGLAGIDVARQPRVMVLSSGDELVEPGQPIECHQVRRSNAYGVAAALRLHALALVQDEHLRDDEALMRLRLAEVLAAHDVVVISGGMSKGRFDFGPAVLRALGVREVLHHVAQRPGHPLWFGTGRDGQLVFGLPGNPVATQVCVRRYVLPAVEAAMGMIPAAPERVAMASTSGGRKLTSLLPVVLHSEGTGATVARVRPSSGSGDLLALAGTHGFVELPAGDALPAGFVADFYRW